MDQWIALERASRKACTTSTMALQRGRSEAVCDGTSSRSECEQRYRCRKATLGNTRRKVSPHHNFLRLHSPTPMSSGDTMRSGGCGDIIGSGSSMGSGGPSAVATTWAAATQGPTGLRRPHGRSRRHGFRRLRLRRPHGLRQPHRLQYKALTRGDNLAGGGRAFETRREQQPENIEERDDHKCRHCRTDKLTTSSACTSCRRRWETNRQHGAWVIGCQLCASPTRIRP